MQRIASGAIMNEQKRSFTRKQKEFLTREPCYRRISVGSIIGSLLIFVMSRLYYAKGDEGLSFCLLLLSIFCLALATAYIIQLVEIESIKHKVAKHKLEICPMVTNEKVEQKKLWTKQDSGPELGETLM